MRVKEVLSRRRSGRARGGAGWWQGAACLLVCVACFCGACTRFLVDRAPQTSARPVLPGAAAAVIKRHRRVAFM